MGMRHIRSLVLGALAVALVVFVVTAVRAQQSGTAHTVLLAQIHGGTCADLEPNPRHELSGPAYGLPILDTPMGTPSTRFYPVGALESVPVVASTTRIDASLDDLLATPHALVIRIVEEASGTDVRLACGGVGGVRTDGDLVFGLRTEAADTTGIAWLHDNGDGTTTVYLFVTQGLSKAAPPVAPPAPAPGEPTPSPAPAEPTPPAVVGDVEQGRQLAAQCIACHSTDGSPGVGPTWRGLYGSEVELETGETVIADDEYLRESIVDPMAKIVKGYPPAMPPFAHLSEEQIADLIAYIKSLE